MNEISLAKPLKDAARPIGPAAKTAVTLTEHIVEVISDSGEGAQRCGQSLGAIAARMGNGIWTVEIIPAEIRRWPLYDYVLINDDLQATFDDLLAILRAERRKRWPSILSK